MERKDRALALTVAHLMPSKKVLVACRINEYAHGAQLLSGHGFKP